MKRRKVLRCSLLAVAAGLALSSMVETVPVYGAEQVPAAAMKEADDVWKTRCSTCHGMTGKGDGPAGAALNPRPRDLTAEEWQKSVTDEHIEKIIVGGGPAVGKSPLMPPNPDLASKADVVKGLRVIVRNLATKK